MNLICLNDIITDNLAIHIDLTKLGSWNLNTGLTTVSLSKWNNAISSSINLIDFGLTEFDNGRTNMMYEGIRTYPSNNYFTAYRIGYNTVINPTTGNTSGSTVTTQYDLYPMSAVTSSDGNYFELNGGYLQGYFKLPGYNFEQLPARYSNGITIETLVNINANTHGIFFMMGVRAEDKYNAFFSGETTSGLTATGDHAFIGVKTSDNNTLESINRTTVNKASFRNPESKTETKYTEKSQIANIGNNVIAFEITEDNKLGYKYINGDGILIQNSSPNTINAINWATISVVFSPNSKIVNLDIIECAPRRTGKLIFYINGRSHWIINDFPEFYFYEIKTNKNLQIGVPYSISWGGGSFGLKHSWHYDLQKYSLFTNQDNDYLISNFITESDPFPSICDIYSGGTILSGMSYNVNTVDFNTSDICNPILGNPKPVIEIQYTGETTTTGNTYFFKFNQSITVLSNREYEIDLSIFNDGFFNAYNSADITVQNKASIVVYGTTDVDIISEIEYIYPINGNELYNLTAMGLYPFPDRQQYQYLRNGIVYYGVNGVPVVDEYSFLYGNLINTEPTVLQFSTGELTWKPVKCKFKLKDNTGKQVVNIGILFETNYGFNLNKSIFISDFTYSGADILVQDTTKENLMIEENFNNSFIGGIQKLRIYDKALTSPEILHNAKIEKKKNNNINVLTGGRIIGNLSTIITSNLQWINGLMFNDTLLYNDKIWNNE
jgi:hypothetical protein